ncbi:beta propeller repeat protein [Methylomarinum vadi]|uniref:hypothetical protein n=1 Tax=Methylomarinum vadi TaxID=438855 RepID=UPI0004DF951D|nr:hypothetical protein [Methylomarinum vadi]
MKLNSSINMQISSVVDAGDDRLFFRAFSDLESEVPNLNKTYIIESYNGAYNLLRVIDEEIASLSVTENGGLFAIGKNGNIYKYSENNWQDIKAQFKPIEYLFRSIVHKDVIYSACTGGSVFSFSDDAWENVCSDVGDDDLDLISICHGADDLLFVCGENGILASISVTDNAFKVIGIPTNAYLYDIKKIDNDNLAVCGRNGTFFIGNELVWRDFSRTDLNVSFSSVEIWRDELYLSASDRVLLFHDGNYTEFNIPSLNLIGLKNGLWSIALKKLHKFNGLEWEEVIVEINV